MNYKIFFITLVSKEQYNEQHPYEIDNSTDHHNSCPYYTEDQVPIVQYQKPHNESCMDNVLNRTSKTDPIVDTHATNGTDLPSTFFRESSRAIYFAYQRKCSSHYVATIPLAATDSKSTFKSNNKFLCLNRINMKKHTGNSSLNSRTCLYNL